MSGLTGYKTIYGTDLSYIFISGTNTTRDSGYTLNRGDLSDIFARNTSSVYAQNTGYLISNNQDISRIYEPLRVTITNSNFTSPNRSASPYWAYNTTLTGWTETGSFVASSSASNWNTASLTSIVPACTQYCGLQNNGSNIAQTISLLNISYNLSFWIIGRNQNGSAYLFTPSKTTLTVTVGVNTILSGRTIGATSWINVNVRFTIATSGSYSLKFANVTTEPLDSSFLFTGIVITAL